MTKSPPKGVSVSKSSIGTFDDCERRWALQYRFYNVPPEMERDVQYQRRLMGANALVGQIADDCITYLLRHYHKSGEWRDDVKRGIANLLQQYLDDTARWRTQYEAMVSKPESGRRQPIDRVFFGNPYSPEELDEIREAALLAVRSWQESPVPGWLVELGTDHWHPPAPAETPFFVLNGFAVWANYDFIVQTPEQTIIFDWKTGKRNQWSEESLIDQLHTYAQYVQTDMNASLETTRLFGVWLSLGHEFCLEEVRLDVARLEGLKRRWIERHALLTGRLKGLPFGGGPLIFERFPPTGYPNKCASCPFHACEYWQQVADSKA